MKSPAKARLICVVCDIAHTNGIESFWSLLKRGCIGMKGTRRKRARSCGTNDSDRPATGQGTQIQVRLQPDLLLLVDRYAAEHGDISRPEAIRRLVELGLKAND
jgi:hypothetical protein